jgi:diguanylate cyclase (GGDEF)-like protein
MLQTTEEILTPASQAVSLGYFAQLHADLVAGRPPQSFREELEYRCKDGSTVWTEVLAIPLLSNGGLVEVLGVTRDISEHKRLVRELHQAKDATEAANQALLNANEELARMATTDPLTGIWNRRHFELVADAEAAQARRYERPLSLLIFDIDHFKSINDHFGHQTGDHVLIELTELVGQALRDADVLARWGGEEFVVIIPHCGAQDALLLAEKLRALVAGHPFSEVGTVTVSLGAVQYKCDETLDDWFKRVDLALYEAKSGGRNTVRLGS